MAPAVKRKAPVGREEALERLDTKRERPARQDAGSGRKDRPADKPKRGEKPRRDEPRKAPVGREEALERLDTKRERPARQDAGSGRKDRSADKPKRGEKPRRDEPRKDEPQRSRAANVWRAPGARPLGPKKLKKKNNRPATGGTGKPGGKPGRKPRGDHADRRR
jgi:23S rRNA pseudouridine2605 synthase